MASDIPSKVPPRRRVVVLNQFALPRDQGGGTRHVDLFSRCEGWETLIVAGNRNHYSQQAYTTLDPLFRLVDVPRQGTGALSRVQGWVRYTLQAAGLTWRARPDLVYASTPHLLTPLGGLVVSRLLRVPLVLEVRDLWPESIVAAGALRRGSAVHRVLESLERLLVRAAARVVVVTDGWEDHFGRLAPRGPAPVVVPNGTEPYDRGQTRALADRWRQELGLTSPVAVFAGAHGPKDGIDLILDAAKQLPDVQFLLVGQGPAKPAAMRRAEAEQISNAQFLDPVSKDALPGLLGACDVGIHAVTPLPVFQLGMSPNKLFDYLAAGLPVVSNAGEAVRSKLRGHPCGCIGGPDELAQLISRALAAPEEEREEWARNAEYLMQEVYSRSQAAQLLEKTLSSAAGDRGIE